MRYLVDSDWAIDALAGVPPALAALERLEDQGLGVSIISVGEIYEGAFLFSDPATQLPTFRRYFGNFTILGLTEPVMEVFGRNRALLRRQGHLIPDLDLLIAATALSFELVLMTRNRRHFSRIPGLQLHPTGV